MIKEKKISTNTVVILDVEISRLAMSEAISLCSRQAENGLGGYACFVNVHSLTESRSNAGLKASLQEATFAFADGMPLVWVSSLRSMALRSRVCGPDFMTAFLKANRNYVHGFIGGRPGQSELISSEFGIAGIHYSPPMRAFSVENAEDDWKQFLKLCSEGKIPLVVWVGLGAPKQELWMRHVCKIAPNTLFFGVGAAFDFLAGSKDRAPSWMQRVGLEWLFRLAAEPRRLWKRYLVSNSVFIVLTVCELVKSIFCKQSRSTGE